ncbi:hypothetical protein [uncultured Tenacibaculum sp.]|uniref:hypothetical protein n=1 Tax=uncultured Tenacibaculum sp. TaxID=174713 RepID=UPI00260FB842|nr:hypothetical protein [uncultured Tenacibaculum sp.]
MKKTNLLKLLIIFFTLNFMASCEKHKCKCDNDDWQSQIPEGTFCYSDEGRTLEMLDYTEIVSMLKEYDTTRIAPLEKALGYEDSRINTYNFKQFLKYLGRVKNLSKKVGIEVSGISFISAAMPNYNNTGRSYQDLIYIPTTTIGGKQVAFDPLQSYKQGKLVTFKEMLAKNGYNWIYNSLEEFNKGKREDYNYSIELLTDPSNEPSGAGNKGNLEPPYGTD